MSWSSVRKGQKGFERNFLSVGPGRMIAVTFPLKRGLENPEKNGYTDFR
jgi:hypothetical protein